MNPDVTGNETKENPGKRDANGRFGKGNAGGPGNPFARQTARLRQALVDAVTPDDMRAIAGGLKTKAVQGDVPAAKLLFSYCIGKEDPDTLDRHELRTIIANHLDSAEGPLNVLKGMPLDVLVEMFRLILPVLRSDKVKLAKKVLCAPLTAEELEDAQGDDDDDPDETAAAAPAADIPAWMHDIGKDAPPPAAPPARKRKQTARPKQAGKAPGKAPARSEAEVDAELLRVLLERARNLPATAVPPAENEQATAPGEPSSHPLSELLKASHGRRRPPSTNGANGKK
jgi:hypothetical protein